MADYPSLAQAPGSAEERVDDLRVSRADGGAVRGQSFYTAAVRRFRIRHTLLTPANKATLDTFYTNNKTSTGFNFLWSGDGNTYTCIFSAPPKYSLPQRAQLYDADVMLETA